MKVEIRMEAPHDDPKIKQAIDSAADALGQQVEAPADAALTVLVTGDDDVRALNNQFLDIDAPTDVLSFPSGDPIDGENPYLGDIIISLETAARQAEAGGHALAREVELLVIHGLLHLFGHDHGDPEGKSAMWAAQASALKTLGNPLSPP
jgi:probable rRNA maturation factor